MGWSRNLGVTTSEELEAKAKVATSTESVDMVKKEFLTTSQLDPNEQPTLQDALEMARAGLVLLGGVGDVHLGGQVRFNPDGTIQRSITATVTVTTKAP